MAGIVLDRVSKVYADGTTAVSELSIDIHDEEFIVLVGPVRAAARRPRSGWSPAWRASRTGRSRSATGW